MLKDRVVVLVSDGFANTASVGVALDFLKPIRILRLVVASPAASVAVVDRLHITADELHLLDVKENFWELIIIMKITMCQHYSNQLIRLAKSY